MFPFPVSNLIRSLTHSLTHSLTGAVDAARPDPLVVVFGPHDAVQDLLLLLAVVNLLPFATRQVNVVVVTPERITL